MAVVEQGGRDDDAIEITFVIDDDQRRGTVAETAAALDLQVIEEARRRIEEARDGVIEG